MTVDCQKGYMKNQLKEKSLFQAREREKDSERERERNYDESSLLKRAIVTRLKLLGYLSRELKFNT